MRNLCSTGTGSGDMMRACGPRFRRWPECVPVAGVRLLVQGSRVRKVAKLDRTEFAAHRQKAWLVGFLLFWGKAADCPSMAGSPDCEDFKRRTSRREKVKWEVTNIRKCW